MEICHNLIRVQCLVGKKDENAYLTSVCKAGMRVCASRHQKSVPALSVITCVLIGG